MVKNVGVTGSPADDDEELDEKQRLGGAAVVLRGAGEVERAVP